MQWWARAQTRTSKDICYGCETAKKTEKIQFREPDHDAIDDPSHTTAHVLQQPDMTVKQHQNNNAQYETTLATSDGVLIHETESVTTTTQILTVRVLCPMCSSENPINMDKLWQKVGTNRLCYISCMSCQKKTRLGEWSSSQDVQRPSVKQWLQRHSYNGKTFLKHDSRPPTATVELFNGVAATTTTLQKSESLKRKPQDVADDNAKRRRRDETQPKWNEDEVHMTFPLQAMHAFNN